ncbi:hypothetical protein LCGC14_1240290 [marine sediment metagenome]|uniref:Uncharacterized protein n=1 Tax=marine sediment metagenome TaxID=412755 RepID=A0A0F9L648_9ZZZZ
MITYEFNCPVHERFEVDLEFGSDVPVSALCPVMLYEYGEDDTEESYEVSVVLCGEDSPRIISLPTVIVKLEL